MQTLGVAQQMGVLKLGQVALDGTKIKANAGAHKALSWKHALKLEAQLAAEVAELLKKAQSANVAACAAPPEGQALITPSIALSREAHHLPLQQRFAPTPPEPPEIARRQRYSPSALRQIRQAPGE